MDLTTKIKKSAFLYHVYYYAMSGLVNLYKLFLNADPKLILFVCYGGRRYSDSTRVIYEAMLKDERFKDYTIYWAFTHPENYPNIPNRININSVKYFNLALRARCWVTNVMIERALNFKGIKTYYFQTTHGILPKLDGKDAIGNNFKTLAKKNIIDCCLAQSEYESFVYAGLAAIPIRNMAVIGMPKNDIFAHYTDEQRNELRKMFKIPEGKKAILYAPTFREEANFKEVFDFDVKVWESVLGDDYVLLYRAHPVVVSMNKVESDFFIDTTHYEVVEDIMIASDILVSDYSGILFDYSIMQKPIFLWPYDFEKYNKVRGLYMDLRKELPYKIDQRELAQMIKDSDLDAIVKNFVVPFKNKYVSECGDATRKSLELIYQNIQ
ncbi:CDP-glycerol glycerophosphotransferase family protein [Bacteroides bouchesdurhonensis]|uniref:CDP-glycerol glycerophosphotransferase family protein n=1 Tax=Bacteroides bouchesdurhonensis TaxID=1841855 RepID=UPI00097FA4C4|nr:CDP-glycerol glycerophosphotransferase family protein [Bacteroides bouchesdurhonensis]